MYLKKSELINIIQDLKTFEQPKVRYEQYFTDAIATADIFFHIAFEQNDLSDRIVIDLGCGTGNLTVAAAILGAKKVIGIDIDADALAICSENLQKLDLESRVLLFNTDITKINWDEFIQKNDLGFIHENHPIMAVSNPPFGVKHRGVDLLFLKRGLEIADIIYSLHLSNSKGRTYLTEKIQKNGGRVDRIFPLSLVLKHSYSFHSQKFKRIATDLYRITRI